jgi:UDP-N-acetylmuramyl pentapeptide phosphotransferase/UDP-N-acetylglucosamine-1-phosphate transferase
MIVHDNLVSVKANLRSKLRSSVVCSAGRSQNQPVSFWIISMMLVLIGLSTLKLR